MFIVLFWILLAIIFYTYVGYTILLQIVALFIRKPELPDIADSELPEVTLLIAAYNEKDIIRQKLSNSMLLDYPKDKVKHLWITDGSDDGSEELLKQYPEIQVLHQPIRNGKTAAINRAMKYVSTPITVLSDANTMLSPLSVRKLTESFANSKVGCVAGEKRIISQEKDSASGAGEGIYWSYESYIKKLESVFGSTLGAAGEIYAIRSELYSAPAENTVLDDFVVSLSIAEKGYKIHYRPEAFAKENSSFSIREELKRKIRIAAGSFQVLFRMPTLLNFFRHFKLSFQYISHKVLRWLFVPFALPLVLFLNVLIVIDSPSLTFYTLLLSAQIIFYLLVILGSLLKEKVVRVKWLFYPFYLIMMNYSLFLGLFRFCKGTQNAAWEKVKRQN